MFEIFLRCIARYILDDALMTRDWDSCPHLLLKGLMTIGMVDYSPNPDCFARLVQVIISRTAAAAAAAAAAPHCRRRLVILWRSIATCRCCSHSAPFFNRNFKYIMQAQTLELSMGMSGDFEQAISMCVKAAVVHCCWWWWWRWW